MYRLCSKFDINIDLIENEEPYILLAVIEGRIEQQREYFEFMNYSLYSAIGQLLGSKKEFKNPFEKKEMEKTDKPTKEIQEKTLETLQEIFGLNTNEQ